MHNWKCTVFLANTFKIYQSRLLFDEGGRDDPEGTMIRLLSIYRCFVCVMLLANIGGNIIPSVQLSEAECNVC